MNNQRFIQGYITLIFFGMLFYGVSTQAVGTLISRIIVHYDIRMAQAGLISSFTSVGNFTAIVVIFIFAGRINKLILMGISLFFYSVSLYLISVAPPFGIVLASFSLIGVFGATTDTLTSSLVADLLPANISRNISLLHGFFGLGGLSGPILIERLAGNISWAQVYFIISLVFFSYLLLYAMLVKWQWSLLSLGISHQKKARFGFSDITNFFTQKRNILLWVTMFFYAGNQSIMAVWIKRYVETHLAEPALGVYALSAMWLGITICRLFISPNIKASSPAQICAGNFISAVFLAAGLLSGSVWGIIAASLVVGLSSGLTIPLILALGCEWYQEKTAFGAMMPFTAVFISSVIFPPFAGLVSDYLGLPWGVALAALNALLTAVFSALLKIKMSKNE